MNAKRKAFVLMPFREPFDSYYPAIFRPALEAAGLTVQRADELYTPRPVMLDIQESIVTSDLILCEMTGRNPNVFYELGLAHAVGKPVLLLSTKEEDIPFDLRHVRVIHYDPRMAGWEAKLRTAIEKAAVAAVSSPSVWPPPLTSVATANQGRSEAAKSMREGRDPRVVDRPLNLGFDGAVEAGFPHGWFNSAGYVAMVSLDYSVRVVERDDGVVGRCLMVCNDTASRGEFGSVMQRFPGEFLAGRTVRLEGELRTQEVSGWAGLWLRADGKEVPDVFFDNMSSRRLRGTTGWASYAVEAKLPPATVWLNFGVVLGGSGVVWADSLRLLSWNKNGTWTDV